jgi:protein phosphatase
MSQNDIPWTDGLEYAAISDVGLMRANNQDAVAVSLAGSEKQWRRKGHLFLVADGMGAHRAGELASQMAVDLTAQRYRRSWFSAPPTALAGSIAAANDRIYYHGQASEDCRGMGTTLSGLVLLPEGAVVGHVGDSRVYRVRGSHIEQLTFDHSLAWEISAAEGYPYGEAPDYVPRNVVTRSVGPHLDVKVDLEGPYPLQIGDTFLLCSDGLSGLLDNKEIGAVLRCFSPTKAARVLVDLALVRGGTDNVTVLVVQVAGPELLPAAESDDPEPRRRPWLQYFLWAVLVVLLLSGLGSLAAGHPLAALVQLVLAVAAGVGALVPLYRKLWPGRRFAAQKLGKGPYAYIDCTPDEAFIGVLDDTLQQLQQIAVNEGRRDEFCPLQEYVDRAAAAMQDEDYTEAVREYCRAVTFAVGKLTNRQ